MTTEAKIEALKQRFLKHSDWEDRYRELIKLGKSLSEMEEEAKLDKYKIKGCQSQVWLKPSYKDGLVHFQADSDAVLVKGIIALLVEAYSGLAPKEIITLKADFLKEIGISDHLSMNRTNGLASMIKQIQMYAFVFNSLNEKGVLNADNI